MANVLQEKEIHMSRIGNLPISIPKDVTVALNGDNITVKGPKGTLARTIRSEIKLVQEEGRLCVVRNSEERITNSLHGLTRTLVANMVKGVTEGFNVNLQVIGVGYRVAMEGKKLNMQIGYSHPVIVDPPEGLSCSVSQNTKITVSGIDKQAVGDLAAFIRSKRPPEVYKGKGIKYEDEYIRRKAGKAASKKK
jgi:large subunit ribosomal protein L6